MVDASLSGEAVEPRPVPRAGSASHSPVDFIDF